MNVGLTQVTGGIEQNGSTKKLQLTVVNIADADMTLEEISGTEQKVMIPKNATATLGFEINDRQEPLKFKAYEKGTGKEIKLNGDTILPVDIEANGIQSIIVAHKEGERSILLKHKITFITACDGPFRREIDKATGSTKHHF